MSVGYKTFGQLNLPLISEEVLKQWESAEAFKKSIELREGNTPFVFYEGPPSANGMPGIHHVISRTLKDLVCRYKTMQGFQVKRKGGWDTHGLPIELGVEKLLGITKEDIGKKISVEDYNKKCREVVMQYKDKWDDITQKMGYWVDLDNPYVTFENNYIETLWWCLSQLYKKDYLYESVSIQPYSPAAGTGLSSHELNQPGTYKDVKDTSATVMFKVERVGDRQDSNKAELLATDPAFGITEILAAGGFNRFGDSLIELVDDTNIFFLAWTTTPWTLPSNLGLTVGPEIDYVLVKLWNQYDKSWFYGILADKLLPKIVSEKYFEDLVIDGIYAASKQHKIDGSRYIPDGHFSKNGIEYLIEVKKDLDASEEGLKQLYSATLEIPNSRGIFFTFNEVDKEITKKYSTIEFRCFEEYIFSKFKGSDLEGIKYEQLLPFEANSEEKIEEITPGAKPFRVILGDFVTTEDGTGIVHTSPAFGADDYRVGKKNNLGILTLVDKQGKFVDGVGEFSGRFVKNYKDEADYVDVNVDISVKLKKENRAFKVEKYEHSYPHCWRTDKPIIYYPLDAWFIRTTAVKDKMVELNKTINWKPASTGTGRFGNWLENMVDWNLSRSRFWGTPMPIWKTEDGDEEICIGSIAQLNEEIKKAAEVLGGETNKHYLHEGILDLHKPYVDDIVLVSATGKPMKRVPDLIDVWFDSGAMPYAQWGLPDASSNEFGELSTENFWKYHAVDQNSPLYGQPENAAFPADFIAEGVDQTRGWFYTLHALGALLFDNVAYKTVVSNGLVLDKNGVKMSKRLGNIVDPFTTINNYGADATRWYLITNASPWDSLKFDEDGIKEVQRKFFGTLYNTYQFFALYANVDGFTFKEEYIPLRKRPEIDQWILSSLNTLIKNVTDNFDTYEPTQAGRAIEEFVDTLLSNWYVRLCRRRFWKGEYEQDKIAAYQTLYECLETISRLIAPIAPFFADWLFQNLNAATKRVDLESVHHSFYPKADEAAINVSLETRMQLAQDTCSLILSLRKKVNIKVRQPLQKVFIPAQNETMAADIKLIEDIIKSETNIKEIELLAVDNDFIRKKAKANFKTLGKKLGSKMKWAASEIEKFSNETIEKVQNEGFALNNATIAKDEEQIIINAEDIEIITDEIPGYEIASKGTLTVALDIVISVELKQEGYAREFVNRVQNIRKDNGFELTDKVEVFVSENETVHKSFMKFKDYICAEILAEKLEFVADLQQGTQIEVNDATLKVNVIKK